MSLKRQSSPTIGQLGSGSEIFTDRELARDASGKEGITRDVTEATKAKQNKENILQVQICVFCFLLELVTYF